MSTRSQFNSKSPTIRRILREASELSTSLSPDYTATPLDDNLFEWHFTLRGPPGGDLSSGTSAESSKGPYHDGIYHGRIVLPPTYPLRPPSFRFLTPSGRFETNREICLSISGHHEETWQPAWGLRTALVALRTFMETDPKGQLGGLECSDAVRRTMASQSRVWKCAACAKTNLEILTECEKEAAKTAFDPDAKKPDDAVPKELQMGWRDEMRPADATVEAGSSSSRKNINGNNTGEGSGESDELAEGFVSTAQSPGSGGVQSAADGPGLRPQPVVAYPAARPAQTVPQPTGTVPLPPATHTQAQAAVQLQQQRLQSNDGVPEWVDKAIIGVVACLIVMILKMLLS